MTTNLSSFLGSTYIGNRGFGLFNSEIDLSQSYTLTTSMASALTFPAGDQKYLVRSILLTNIGTEDATFSADFYFDDLTLDIKAAAGIPLNVGSTIELIKKPKIFSPADQIKLQASTGNTIQAYITYQSDTTLNYFGTGVNITGTSNTDIFTASSGDAVLESIHIANISSTVNADFDLFLAESNGTLISNFAKNFIVPTNAVIELNEQPKVLSQGQKIIAKAPVGDIFSVVVSGIYR
jgi:hypothetical protein